MRDSGKQWFLLYFTTRTQNVIVTNSVSNTGNFLKRVPQGSNLGSLIILISINDMKQCCILLERVQYSDDTTFYTSGKILTTTYELAVKSNKSLVTAI